MSNFRKIKLDDIGNEKIGYLSVIEQNQNIPFEIKRVYYSYDVPKGVQRGGHAHKNLEQVLICVNGSIKVKCFDGNKEEVFVLDHPTKALYIKNLVWRDMYDYSKDAVLVVLASEFYDEKDYIRDYNYFLKYLEESSNKNKSCFIHPKAIVDTNELGVKTKVWGFSHIFKGARIGQNCNICEHVLIENDVTIGNNVTVKSGVYIWDGIYIEDDVFIGPSVSFVNDKYPRSKKYPQKFSKTYIKNGASIGSNATIMCNITIGEYATIGAGSVVLNDVNQYEVVVGNPAKVIGYNCICGSRLHFKQNRSECKCGLKYRKNNNLVEKVKN